MIGLDNQAATRFLPWLERALLAAGALAFAAMGIMRTVTGHAPAFPYSLVWLLAAALLGAGIALVYWRLAAPHKDQETS